MPLPSLSSKLFFDILWRNTEEGFFADPLYGGNRDKIGWRLVGFVDQHAWQPPFGHYDADYPGFEPYDKDRQS